MENQIVPHTQEAVEINSVKDFNRYSYEQISKANDDFIESRIKAKQSDYADIVDYYAAVRSERRNLCARYENDLQVQSINIMEKIAKQYAQNFITLDTKHVELRIDQDIKVKFKRFFTFRVKNLASEVHSFATKNNNLESNFDKKIRLYCSFLNSRVDSEYIIDTISVNDQAIDQHTKTAIINNSIDFIDNIVNGNLFLSNLDNIITVMAQYYCSISDIVEKKKESSR